MRIQFFCLSLFFFSVHFLRSESLTGLFHSKSIEELNERLKERSFHGVEEARYESSIWTGIAALETRAYPWSMKWWRKQHLKAHPRSTFSYYSGVLPAYYYEGSGDKLLIIFGTSFGTFGTGTWYRKIISKVKARHPKASFLVFPGYLSKESILDAKPHFPDPGVRFVAQEYWDRIEHFLAQKAAEGRVYSHIGSIGLSGGASLVLRLLQIKATHKEPTYLSLNWGNLALSPVLSAEAGADVVDVQAAYLEENEMIKSSTFDVGDWMIWRMIGSFLPFSKKVNAGNMLELTREPRSRKYKRLQSLVAYSVIHEMRKVIKWQSPNYTGATRLKDYYEDYSFPIVKKHLKETVTYREYSSFYDAAKLSAGPLKLVFSEDDPVLSVRGVMEPEARGHSLVNGVLSVYKRNPRVRVDHLRFGGHIGYLLEDRYVENLLSSEF